MIRDFYSDESGQGMVEYGLLVALIAVVAIVAVRAIGTSVPNMFQDVSDTLENPTATTNP